MKKITNIFILLILFGACKKDVPQPNDYTELRAHVRGYFEVFAVSEILTNRFEFLQLDSFFNKVSGQDSFISNGIFNYNDGRRRIGQFNFGFKNILADSNTTYNCHFDYFRDSIAIKGQLKIQSMGFIPNTTKTKKSIKGKLIFKYNTATEATVVYDLIQIPTNNQRNYSYEGQISTTLNNGKTAKTNITVPIENVSQSKSGAFNLNFIRPIFGQGSLTTSSQKGVGVMIFGYDPNGFEDDFLYIGFPEDNDLQMNMRMQLY